MGKDILLHRNTRESLLARPARERAPLGESGPGKSFGASKWGRDSKP